MTTLSREESDALFLTRLEASKAAVGKVAGYLESVGAVVEVQETLVRPSYEERHQFIDNGDLRLTVRPEVKNVSLSFTCCDDYPYDNIIIDEALKVDRIPKAQRYGWFIVSKELTHCAFVSWFSFRSWKTKLIFDSKVGRKINFYICPKAEATFFALSTDDTRA